MERRFISHRWGNKVYSMEDMGLGFLSRGQMRRPRNVRGRVRSSLNFMVAVRWI